MAEFDEPNSSLLPYFARGLQPLFETCKNKLQKHLDTDFEIFDGRFEVRFCNFNPDFENSGKGERSCHGCCLPLFEKITTPIKKNVYFFWWILDFGGKIGFLG